MKEYGSWVCGRWKRKETELICCKFSKCTKDYFQFSSAISLLSVRQLQHVDTPPRLQNADAIWTLDVSFLLKGD